MFEISIPDEIRNGIKLHRKDGTEYWKLALTCTRDSCDNEVDFMGECLCFDEESKMIHCRDNHDMYCSTKCWYKSIPRERIDEILKDIKKNNELCESHGDHDYIITGDTELELIENYFNAIAENYDGSDFWDEYGIEECPI